MKERAARTYETDATNATGATNPPDTAGVFSTAGDELERSTSTTAYGDGGAGGAAFFGASTLWSTCCTPYRIHHDDPGIGHTLADQSTSCAGKHSSSRSVVASLAYSFALTHSSCRVCYFLLCAGRWCSSARAYHLFARGERGTDVIPSIVHATHGDDKYSSGSHVGCKERTGNDQWNCTYLR